MDNSLKLTALPIEMLVRILKQAGSRLITEESIAEDIAAGAPTDYAIYKDPHMTEDFVCCGWWLRDRTGNYDAAIVDQSGKVVADGYQINDAHVGVRPAIWVTVG